MVSVFRPLLLLLTEGIPPTFYTNIIIPAKKSDHSLPVFAGNVVTLQGTVHVCVHNVYKEQIDRIE